VEEKVLYKMFSKALKADDKIEVQAAACEAACKLMLGLVVKDEELLKTLVIAYFDPGTAENLGLRQGLSYFLPVYCHSRAENQMKMQRIAVAAIHSLILLHDNLDEEEEMVSPVTIASHLADWTDPRKVVGARDVEAFVDDTGRKETSKTVDGTVHLDLVRDVLEKIASNTSSKLSFLLASSPLFASATLRLCFAHFHGAHRRGKESLLQHARQVVHI
jgi:condensin complex subunit 3